MDLQSLPPRSSHPHTDLKSNLIKIQLMLIVKDSGFEYTNVKWKWKEHKYRNVFVCRSDYRLADGCLTLFVVELVLSLEVELVCVEALVTENTAAGHDRHDQPVWCPATKRREISTFPNFCASCTGLVENWCCQQKAAGCRPTVHITKFLKRWFIVKPSPPSQWRRVWNFE